MPNTARNATLDVRNSSSSQPGWVNVQASNNQTYSYCYAGGDDNAGGMTVNIGSGRTTLNIRSIADHRYNLTGCGFTGTGYEQMSWNGNSAQAGEIVDANTGAANVKYTITVTDTGNGNCTIPCDPMIKNVPPPPPA